MSNKENYMNKPNLSSFDRVNSSSDSEYQFEEVSAEVVREILDFLNLDSLIDPLSEESNFEQEVSTVPVIQHIDEIIHRKKRLLTLLNCQVMSWKYQDLVYWYSIFINLIIELSIFLCWRTGAWIELICWRNLKILQSDQ